MPGPEDLLRQLRRIDGRGYPAYKAIKGAYDFPIFRLIVDHVQGDPFAEPSRLRIVMPREAMGFPSWAASNPARRDAAADWLVRRFRARIAAVLHRAGGGTGKSGLLAIDPPGQQVLRTSAAIVGDHRIEIRFVAGLPADGRRIRGRHAATMLLEQVPALVAAALRLGERDRRELAGHVESVEDQAALRAQLAGRGLIAFVADGALLPRESGASDRPLRGAGVIPFETPASLAVELDAPNAGPVRGLGIPEGVALIVGGGYHGKSTLLRGLAYGVYDHVPGDGRERVVTVADAVKIRAEDGRRVEGVDISPFIRNLPDGTDTALFRSEAASGSTSQAANIVEALELGARVLLIDEDTSATNFMIRDRRMQELVHKEAEPITPFIDRVRSLHRDLGVSTVLVLGGSGDYLDVADTIIRMDRYRALEVTAEARRVAAALPTGRMPEAETPLQPPPPRVPLPESVDPRRGQRVKVRARGTDEIAFGEEDIDLYAVEQVIHPAQTRAIAAILRFLREAEMDGRTSLRPLLDHAMARLEREGLDLLSPYGTPVGDLALPRRFEVGAALNRLRTLRTVRME